MTDLNNNKIKFIRKQNNLTQKKMAMILNISEAGYNRKEKGNRGFTIKEIYILSNYFKVSIDELFLY